jgi:hypothetical protein
VCAFPRTALIFVATILLDALAPVPGRASEPTSRSWVALGVGLAPSPYGADGNGSSVCDVSLGKDVRGGISVAASLTRFEFLGYLPARFAVLSTAVRAHLSKQHSNDGGPYIGLASVICYGRFRDLDGSRSRLLPGIEASVGAVIPLSSSLAFDWAASHVVTTDAGGFTPHPITRETKRDGLDR